MIDILYEKLTGNIIYIEESSDNPAVSSDINILSKESIPLDINDYDLSNPRKTLIWDGSNIAEIISRIGIKDDKIAAVSRVTVETSTNKIFDGDEASQDRMVRAVQIADITAQTTTTWKMADNSIVEVTLDELKEALALAGQAMSEIWLA